MWPTEAEVRTAAYHRWQRRGGVHGYDRHDWQAAEGDLIFRLNYRVVSRVAWEPGTTLQPSSPRPRCRFCERCAPDVTFGCANGTMAWLPGLSEILGAIECDECGESSRTMAESFDQLARPFRAVTRVRGLSAWPSYRWDGRWAGTENRAPASIRLDRPDGTCAVWHRSLPYVPLAALKFLTRAAVALLPSGMTEEYSGTMEWASNPDHALDRRTLGLPLCRVYLAPAPFPVPWVALARRLDETAPVPSTLVFLAAGHALFQAAVPLCTGDDELDGEPLRFPSVGLPGDAEGPPWECPWLDVPLDSAELRHGASLELVYTPDAALGC